MSLEYFKEKIKERGAELYLSLVILLIGLLGFGLGRLSVIEDSKVPIIIRSNISAVAEPLTPKKVLNNGQYLASKNGNSYYLPWCSGASRIKDSNRIWFKTKDEAELAGYKKSANCRGL